MAEDEEVEKEEKETAEEGEQAAEAQEQAAEEEKEAAEAEKEAAKEEKSAAKAARKEKPRRRKPTRAKPSGDPALLLLITSAIIFIFIQLSGTVSTNLRIIFGILFVLYSALFIEGGIITVVIAVAGLIWWLVFKANLYAGLVIIGILFAFSIFERKKEDPAPEIISGLILIAIFAFDVGLIAYIFSLLSKVVPGTISMTPALEILVRYMPWWVLYALVRTKKEGFLMGMLRLAVVGYLVFITITAIIPTIGFDYNAPGIEEIARTGEQLEQEVLKREHPILSNIWCIFNEPTTVSACIQRRQEDSAFGYICEVEKEFVKGTEPYKKCINEQKEKKAGEEVQAKGVVDASIIEFTKIELKKSADFPAKLYQPQYPLFIELTGENPHFAETPLIQVEPRCHFMKGKEKIDGNISSERLFDLSEENIRKNIVCKPSVMLESGPYKVVFEAIISNLKTKTWLNRLFVGLGKSKERKDQLQKEYFSGLLNSHLTMGPPEFVRVNFLIGEPPENPLIEGDDFLLLVSSIENRGQGEIVGIQRVNIDMLDDFYFREPGCISQMDIPLTSPKEKSIPLRVCAAEIANSQLQNPEKFIPREYEATIWYSYKISQELPFNVVLMES